MGLRRLLSLCLEDIQTARVRDPAARSMLEVLLCYPGVHAIWAHRVCHSLWHKDCLLLARLISQWARMHTGIEIHPGAVIGRRLFIDHGMGVVIGETATVGDDVTLFHGVTLGGTSLVPNAKRHPSVGNGVVMGAHAVALGPITIADGAKVGAGAVVLHNVPAGMTAVGVPARIKAPARQ
ncbi:MAG: serine O-acetyltransferase [Vampirovibrionales bacterium]|nr:serine O-acetyltransferase [Vampirovibrionales bacterium]